MYYKCGVYDVTDFSGHPGGVGRLEMAAGGDLSVYWSTYTQHNRGHVVDYWLQMYKIGEVTEETMNEVNAETYYDADAVYVVCLFAGVFFSFFLVIFFRTHSLSLSLVY